MAIKPVHPKEFRELTGMSIAQISLKSKVPVDTLKGWFSKDGSKRKTEPPPYMAEYFGYLLNDIQNQ